MIDSVPDRSGFLPGRVVQLHVTTRCNLTCAHCYSSSSPHENRALDVRTTVAALRTLFREGFERVSVSGGEPFLYPRLDELVTAVSGMGMHVSIVSNGTRFKPTQLERLAGRIDAVAVSFDGMPPNHDRVRARPGAFAKAEAGIGLLREHRIPHGVIACITRESLADVPDLYEFAKRSGARLFQVRPLVAAGRGRSLSGIELDAAELDRLVVMTRLLQEADPAFPVQCDLAPTRGLLEQVESNHAPLLGDGSASRLSDVVNPWVIDERGRSQAFVYGGGVELGLPGIAELARGRTALSEGSVRGLRDLVGRTVDCLRRRESRFSDWYGLLSWHAGRVEHGLRWMG